MIDSRGIFVKWSSDDCHWASLTTLQWRHNEGNGVSNHRRFDCLLNFLFRRRSKKTSRLRVTGLCEGNLMVTTGFLPQDHSDLFGPSPTPNYIFILDLTPSFNGLGKDNCKKRRETFKFGSLVCLILEVWWQISFRAVMSELPVYLKG